MKSKVADKKGVGFDGVPYTFHGKRVGLISADGRKYRTWRIQQGHMMLKYQGYGMQKSVLDDLKMRGVEFIELYEELPSGRILRHDIPIGDWRGPEEAPNHGGGVQVFMPVLRLPINVANRRLADAGLTPLPMPELPTKPEYGVDSALRVELAREGIYLQADGRRRIVMEMHDLHLVNAIRALRIWGAKPGNVSLDSLIEDAARRGLVIEEKVN